MEVQTGIYDLLYRLGLTANYIGFFHIACAVQLCIEKQDRLTLMTKCIYPEVAKLYQTNWKTVERNIRTASNIIWKQNRALLEELAHKPLVQKPCSAQLIAILTYAILTMQKA